jgi:hypothetical protein
MIHSPKLIVVANGEHQTGVGFTLGETIRFEGLEFIADRFSSLSLSPEGKDLSVVFMGMVHSGGANSLVSKQPSRPS